MSRYRDYEDAEMYAAEYAEWQDRMERETAGLTADECKEIAGRSEMDDKTFQWMQKRLSEADSIKRQISDLRHKRELATEITTAVCPRNYSLSHYNAGLPFPDEARALVVSAIDAKIKEQEDKLAEL